MPKLINFLRDPSGAVSTDWVVLTGAVIFIGFMGYVAFNSVTRDHAARTSAAMVTQGIPDYGRGSGDDKGL